MQAIAAGTDAYWLDFKCAAEEDGDLKDSNINRFCDVVRGAKRVVIALPDSDPQSAVVWGKRMWTLPEGLLASGNELYIYYLDSGRLTTLSTIEMAAVMWKETDKSRDGEDVQAARLLAEHFSGTLELSLLQLMSTAVVALWDRKDAKQYNPAEMCSVLMGLMHTRIDPIKGNTLFQDIAKLSLLNDSDRLVERMVCLLSSDDSSQQDLVEDAYNNHDPCRMLAKADQFNTHLWDIHTSCDVVGVDFADHTVVLNNCRAIAIRWKRFPKMSWKKSESFKKFAAKVFLRSGAWWFILGFGMAFYYAPFWASEAKTLSSPNNADGDISTLAWLGLGVAFFLGMGLLLSLVGPLSLRVLYGGMVIQPAAHLVGFEGTMRRDKLEKIVFGNDNGRLSYEPSSTLFCKDHRDLRERAGTEPAWVTDPKNNFAPVLKPGHRLFTLVDTGTMAISIFEARRPPTVALICGREGGMLRTVLCSWNYAQDCLRKETVVRMPTEVFEMATPKGWLKLNLDDVPV